MRHNTAILADIRGLVKSITPSAGQSHLFFGSPQAVILSIATARARRSDGEKLTSFLVVSPRRGARRSDGTTATNDMRVSLVAVVPSVLPLTLSGIVGRGHNAVILGILGS